MLRVSELGNDLFGPVSLEIAAGECVALRGPSGTGKSVLMRAIADLDPAGGDVTLNGRSRRSMRAPQWRAQVMLVPAQAGWWADSVHQHFAPSQRIEAMKIAQSLGLPPQAWDWQVDRLSSGEAQRLALVRAMVLQPSVLLLDEPTASLDADATRAVEDLIRHFTLPGRAVLMVTHDFDQAARIAQRQFIVEAGKLIAAQTDLQEPDPLATEQGAH